jgi:iron complex transport system substrate-binding protein
MKYKLRRLVQSFLLIAVVFFLITACHHSTIHQSSTSLPSAKCKIVQHKLGETCIPINPQHIVALDPAYISDPLLSLGIKPVGTSVDDWRGRRYWGGLTSDDFTGVEVIGQLYQPSLEKIALVNPDLILGIDSVELYYQQLSAIAPTVLVDFGKEVTPSYKNHLRSLAQLVGQEDKAEEVLNQYQKRIETLQELIGNRLKELEISIIFYSASTFWAPTTNDALFSEVLKDVGVRFKPILLGKERWTTFSIEVINQYDADILFVGDGDNRTSSFFLQNPIISSLEAAQNNQLYVVDSYVWQGGGPLAMNKVLDDLYKYLPKDE